MPHPRTLMIGLPALLTMLAVVPPSHSDSRAELQPSAEQIDAAVAYAAREAGLTETSQAR